MNQASDIKVDLLTVNVVLQYADALLVQTHHRREEDGLGARVYLHLPVKSLPGKDGRFLSGVTEIGLFCNFRTKKKRVGMRGRIAKYSSSYLSRGTFFLRVRHGYWVFILRRAIGGIQIHQFHDRLPDLVEEGGGESG